MAYYLYLAVIVLAVGAAIIEKCSLSPVLALGNMMRKTRSYDSCTSRHTANKPDALSIDNN